MEFIQRRYGNPSIAQWQTVEQFCQESYETIQSVFPQAQHMDESFWRLKLGIWVSLQQAIYRDQIPYTIHLLQIRNAEIIECWEYYSTDLRRLLVSAGRLPTFYDEGKFLACSPFFENEWDK
jgi:hypothetical protein